MGKSKKNVLSICTILISFLVLSSIKVLANDLNNTEAPIEVTKLVEEKFDNIVEKVITESEQEGKKLEKSKFTLGNSYELYYINVDNNYNKINDFKQFVKKSNQWLYIVNYEEKSNFYITVAEFEGRYEIVSFGGDAQGFEDNLNLYLTNNKDLKEIKVLDDFNDYYLINKESDLVNLSPTIESNISELKISNENTIEIMENEILVDVIKECINEKKERESKNEPVEYGYSSLWQLYQEYIVE